MSGMEQQAQQQPANKGRENAEKTGKELHDKPDAGRLSHEAHHGSATEQKAMWNQVLHTNGKNDTASAHLPKDFAITGTEKDGNRVVKDAKGTTLFDEKAVDKQAKTDSTIKKGESAYQALQRQGMTDKEARQASGEINKEEGLGKKGHREIHVGDSVEKGADGKMHLHHKGDPETKPQEQQKPGGDGTDQSKGPKDPKDPRDPKAPEAGDAKDNKTLVQHLDDSRAMMDKYSHLAIGGDVMDKGDIDKAMEKAKADPASKDDVAKLDWMKENYGKMEGNGGDNSTAWLKGDISYRSLDSARADAISHDASLTGQGPSKEDYNALQKDLYGGGDYMRKSMLEKIAHGQGESGSYGKSTEDIARAQRILKADAFHDGSMGMGQWTDSASIAQWITSHPQQK